MEDTKIQQQIVEKIKSSTNILVTVSRDPSVDELSAALGLTALLDKLEKHSTAIFSGAIPPAITFLDPEKTFENTADSLRDFIIALNKEKADHLRYKVEGDVVKIFITPYRTTITSADLEFSQGDYNVELVLALGVENQANLDTALEAHGRILHDATVATLSAGSQVSSLGSIDWHDETASSLSEMVVSIGEQLKADQPLVDEQIATALLTGIVASTDRFSNPNTTSKVMTMAAQLMAAGADQQLIAAKLQESHEIAPAPNTSGEMSITQDTSIQSGAESTLPVSNNLSIDHSNTPAANVAVGEPAAGSTLPPESSGSTLPPEASPSDPSPTPPPESPAATSDTTLPPTSTSTSTLAPPAVASAEVTQPAVDTTASSGGSEAPIAPAASTEQVAEDVNNTTQSDQAGGVSSRSYLGSQSTDTPPINGASQAVDEAKPVDIFAKPVNDIASNAQPAGPTPQQQPTSPPEESMRDHDDARAAVDAALGSSTTPPSVQQPTAPAVVSNETSLGGLPPPPPVPDFTTMPPPLPDFSAPAPTTPPPASQPDKLGDIFAPQQPQTTPAPAPAPASLPPQPVGNVASDPGQFHIPGQ